MKHLLQLDTEYSVLRDVVEEIQVYTMSFNGI